MKRLSLGLLIVLALANPNFAQYRRYPEVREIRDFIDASAEISGTFEQAAGFAAKLKGLGGVFGLLAGLNTLTGNDAESARHQQVMDEFARVHQGITRLGEQISFLKKNMELAHMKTQLFNAFDVLRKAIELSSNCQELTEFCTKDKCYHALETVAHHAPELLEAYIKSIGKEEDYVKLVPEYAHRLISIVGSGATAVARNGTRDVNDNYIGLDEMTNKITKVLMNSKWHWRQVLDNIILDTSTTMKQSSKSSNHDVLDLLFRKLSPKFSWLSLGILVYNDISGYSKHYITGHRVDVFHEAGKNVVVFIKIKGNDSFKNGPISESMCEEACKKDCPPFSFGLIRCMPRGGAEGCTQKGRDDHSTATIERYQGLLFYFPSDFNYCYRNNDYFTNIAVKGIY